MKLPPNYRIYFRFVAVVMVVLITLFWASRNPERINQLRGMLTPSFSVAPQSWILKIHSKFSLCNHLELEQRVFGSAIELKKALKEKPNYRMGKTNGNIYDYTVTFNRFCKSCRENHFLGVHGQDVVVYRGTPTKPGPILERVTLRTTLLPEAELKDLEAGIPFRDARDKLQLIEGLNGLITE